MEEIQRKRVKYLEHLRTAVTDLQNDQYFDWGDNRVYQQITEKENASLAYCRKSDMIVNGERDHNFSDSIKNEISTLQKSRTYQELWQNMGQQLAILIQRDVQLTDQLLHLSTLVDQIKSIQSGEYETDASSPNSPPLFNAVNQKQSKVSEITTHHCAEDTDYENDTEDIDSHLTDRSKTEIQPIRTRSLHVSNDKAISLVAVNDTTNDADDTDHMKEKSPFCRQYFQRQNSALRIPVKATRKHPRYKYITVVGAVPVDPYGSTNPISRSPSIKQKTPRRAAGIPEKWMQKTENEFGVSPGSKRVQTSPGKCQKTSRKSFKKKGRPDLTQNFPPQIGASPIPPTVIPVVEHNSPLYTMAPRLRRKSFRKSRPALLNLTQLQDDKQPLANTGRPLLASSPQALANRPQTFASGLQALENHRKTLARSPHSPSSSDSGVSTVDSGPINDFLQSEIRGKNALGHRNHCHVISLKVGVSQNISEAERLNDESGMVNEGHDDVLI